MAFVKVQDETSTVSCTFFPRQYASYNVHLTEMTMIHIRRNCGKAKREASNSCSTKQKK